MKIFVPREKLSKKQKRELNTARRTTWGAINPVTRKPANPKAYKRTDTKKKVQKGVDDLRFEPFSFFNPAIILPFGNILSATDEINL